MAPSIWNVALLHFLNILKLNGAVAAAPGDAAAAASAAAAAACDLAVTGTGCAADADAVDGCGGGRAAVGKGGGGRPARAAAAAACMSFDDNGSVDRDPLCEDMATMARVRRWQLAILALAALAERKVFAVVPRNILRTLSQ